LARGLPQCTARHDRRESGHNPADDRNTANINQN
jgi:hypothetical protein